MTQPDPVTFAGQILTPDGPTHGELTVRDGRIAAASPGDPSARVTRGIIVPALTDLGVFAIDKPACHAGGIVRAALMPDQAPPLDIAARVRFLAQSGKPGLWVHPLAAATKGLAGRELAELALMQEAGAKAVATGRHWIADTGVMLRVLQYAAMLDMVVVTHAEDSHLAGNAAATAGEMATRLGLPAAPAEAEALAIARDIALAEMAGARLHIRQATTRAGLDLVRAAKRRGVSVTAGVTPAHFMLSDLALADYRTFMRLSPPLRAEDDRQAVREAIGDGTIDVIASGHDPRGPEDKNLPFADAQPGMAGAQTLLPLTLSLVRDDVIDLACAFDLLSTNPARLLGLNAGSLGEGQDADMAVIDPDAPWIVDERSMAGMAGNTPFDRQPMQGKVLRLWKGGTEIDL